MSKEWLEENHLSERWIKAKYKCLKTSKGCRVHSVLTRQAGRCKCIPCEFLQVAFPNGDVQNGVFDRFYKFRSSIDSDIKRTEP